MKRRRKAKKGKTKKAAKQKYGKKEMLELAEDVGLVSLGLVSMSRGGYCKMADKLRSLRDDSKSEGKKTSKKLSDMAKKRREKVMSVVRKRARSTLGDLNIATKDDLKDLERKLSKGRRSPRRASSSAKAVEMGAPRP
jgi:hypothetical protein